MRLRFLGTPHVSKSSLMAVDFPAACKKEVVENVQVENISPSTPGNDVASPHQLRQRRTGVGLWAIRRQKLERAQLRPRIVVHMSRLQGRRTVADVGAANLHPKLRCRHLPTAKNTPPAVTTDMTTSLDIMETRNRATSTIRDTRVDATNGTKHEKLEEDEAGDDVYNRQVQGNESEQKPAGDAVNLRPKRQIMQKKMVSH